MPRTKRYEPHCPSHDCNGGYAFRLHAVSPESVHMPADVLETRPRYWVIRSCSYCQFVWFQAGSAYDGFDLFQLAIITILKNPTSGSLLRIIASEKRILEAIGAIVRP